MTANTTTTLTIARQYATLGLSIIPIRDDGTKAPALKSWKQFQREAPDDATVQRWFRDGRNGIAILGGAVSGNLLVLDFEKDGAYQSWLALVDEEAPQSLDRLPIARTPGGGVHVYLRLAQQPPGNQKLALDAKGETLIETRGEGGYVLAPGSPVQCHESGRPYEWLSRAWIDDGESESLPAELFDLFIRAARALNQFADKVKDGPKHVGANGARPGDHFNRTATWETILAPHGWTIAKQNGLATYWRRPGKDRGWSATTGYCKGDDGRDLLYVFSSSAAPFAEGRSYSRFAAFVMLNHAGDYKAAARALAEANGTARRYSTPSNNRDGEPMPTPRIQAGTGDLADTTSHAWTALQRANEPPTLFRFGAVPSRIESDDDGQPVVRPMTLDRMRNRLARVAHWFAIVKSGDNEIEKQLHPPLDVVKDVLATPDPPLPVLTRVVECPIFASDGTLRTEPGYSPASKTYFAPRGFCVPTIAIAPSAQDLAEAKQWIDELIGQFPFVAETDKAHAIGAMLLPFSRELIDGPTPIHDFEAPGPGTGKTLLVHAIAVPALGRPVTAMTEGKDDEEWRKRILAKLSSAPTMVLIDNIRRRVESSALASVVTAWPLWEDRLLGKSEIIRVPVRCAWTMTGNNPAYSSEMARRTIRCRLDAKMDQPWLRTGYKHPNLIEWAMENRSPLVCAVLTIIQAWIAAGRPAGTRTLGMFESWAKVIGGILDVSGIPGFLGNLQEFYETADTEGALWRSFVAEWWKAHNECEVKAAELYALAIDVGMHLGDKNEQSQKVRLGQKISEARDRVFRVDDEHSYRIEAAGTHRRAAIWRLVSV